MDEILAQEFEDEYLRVNGQTHRSCHSSPKISAQILLLDCGNALLETLQFTGQLRIATVNHRKVPARDLTDMAGEISPGRA